MADKELIIKPKRAKGEDGYKVFSIRIREEIVSGSMKSPPKRTAAETN